MEGGQALRSYKPLSKFATLHDSFARFGCIAFKLGRFTNFKALFKSNYVVGYSLTGPYCSLTKLKKKKNNNLEKVYYIPLPVSSGFQRYSTEGRQTYEAGFGIKQWDIINM